jgi:hypothetical protein
MSRYAENTQVPQDRSRAEIERILSRYGADQFMYGWQDDKAVLAFRAHGRQIKFDLVMPRRDDPEFTLTPTSKRRSESQAIAAWEQAKRQRWRAAALWIKASLEAVESGFVTFEDAFLAFTLLPDGSTVSQFIDPQVQIAYESGKMPAGLLTVGGSA